MIGKTFVHHKIRENIGRGGKQSRLNGTGCPAGILINSGNQI